MYTVMLRYSFVVQPPPPKGGNRYFVTVPLRWGGTVTTLVGRLQGGGGECTFWVFTGGFGVVLLLEFGLSWAFTPPEPCPLKSP